MILQRGGKWQVGDVVLPFMSRGVGLTWFWVGLAASRPFSLTHSSVHTAYVLSSTVRVFSCIRRAIGYVEPVFVSHHLSVPTWSLCPLTVVPLSNPFHPKWPGQSSSGHPVGPRPFSEHLCSAFPLWFSELCRLSAVSYLSPLFTHTLYPLAW